MAIPKMTELIKRILAIRKTAVIYICPPGLEQVTRTTLVTFLPFMTIENK
jgi:hypothetical protein